MNTRRVLLEGGSKGKDPSELDNSDRKVRHRKSEQKRRGSIRNLLHQISAFFLVEGKVSAGDVILFGKSITSKSKSTDCLPNHFSRHLSERR